VVFYELVGNTVVEGLFANVRTNGAPSSFLSGLSLGSTGQIVAPARDVLHVKLEAKPGDPLLGIPPSRHAQSAIGAQRAIGNQLATIFGNMNRPAGVIETEQTLTEDQTRRLREALNQAWRGVDNLNGGPPVLTNGMKFHGISMSAKDADVAAAIRLTQEEIFMVYGIPPAILGMTDKSAFASVEALMQFWLARGLGFAINHIEVAFDHFFGLSSWPDEYVEFDTRALLRTAYKDRVEGLTRGVQGGLYAPNEARRMEDLPDADNGDKPRVQQQVVPLDWGGFDFQPPPVKEPPPPNLPGGDPGANAPADKPPADAPAAPPAKSLIEIFREGMADYAG
jgi:phage portal protein BeeE